MSHSAFDRDVGVVRAVDLELRHSELESFPFLHVGEAHQHALFDLESSVGQSHLCNEDLLRIPFYLYLLVCQLGDSILPRKVSLGTTLTFVMLSYSLRN